MQTSLTSILLWFILIIDITEQLSIETMKKHGDNTCR